MSKLVKYTNRRPGAVSKNIKRLREQAKMTYVDLANALKLSRATLEKMEQLYEPPANHPYLEWMAKVFAVRLGKKADVVLSMLTKGGTAITFDPKQLTRIYQNHRHMAPDGLFKSSAAPKAKTASTTKVDSRQSLIMWLNTDENVKTLAKSMHLSLPSAKTDSRGRTLKTSPMAQKARATKLVAALKAAGVDIKAAMGRSETGNGMVRNGHRGLGDLRKITYAAVVTFNQRRMLNEKTMIMPMDDFEIMAKDYLKMSGIGPNVLIGSEITKLAPKN